MNAHSAEIVLGASQGSSLVGTTGFLLLVLHE